MGASSWNYVVPYQPDINAALQALRQQEFEAGEYSLVESDYDDMSFAQWVENPDMTIDDYDAVELAEMRVEYDRRQAFTVPATIEDLLWYNGAGGTGSILDMERVATEPTVCAVAPLTSAHLVALFGTDTPTRVQIEERGFHAINHYLDEIGRGTGEGTYIIVYQDNSAHEIYFTGWSGD